MIMKEFIRMLVTLNRKSVFMCFVCLLMIADNCDCHMKFLTNCPTTEYGDIGLKNDSTEYLYETLFTSYNKDVRPVSNIKHPVIVYVKVILKSIEHIDMKTQRQQARIMLELKWVDANLRWDMAQFKNTTRMTVNANKIWLPDVTVESITGSFEFIKMNDIGRAVVDYRGTVTVWPNIFVNLGAEIDVSKYPFDTQNVTFIFGSWSYSSLAVEYRLVKEFFPLDAYQTNVEWEMLDYFSIEWTYDFDGLSYHRVGFQFSIRRRWLYFAMNVIGPVVVTCLLNLLVFLLPAESGQRVTLAISIFLSLTIFLAQINQSLPKTSVGMSILAIYLCLQIVGSVLTIGISVLIIYLNQRAATKEQSSSKVLSFLCRSVIPNQMLKKFTDIPCNATVNESDDAPKSIDSGDDVGSSKQHPLIQDFGLDRSRKSQIFSRNMLVLASECINKTCLWLSVLWNIVLLTVLVIVGALVHY